MSDKLRCSRPAFTKRDAKRLAGMFKRHGGRNVRIGSKNHGMYFVRANMTVIHLAGFASEEARREARK